MAIEDTINSLLPKFTALRESHGVKVNCLYNAIAGKYVLSYVPTEGAHAVELGELFRSDIVASANPDLFVKNWFDAKFRELLDLIADRLTGTAEVRDSGNGG